MNIKELLSGEGFEGIIVINRVKNTVINGIKCGVKVEENAYIRHHEIPSLMPSLQGGNVKREEIDGTHTELGLDYLMFPLTAKVHIPKKEEPNRWRGTDFVSIDPDFDELQIILFETVTKGPLKLKEGQFHSRAEWEVTDRCGVIIKNTGETEDMGLIETPFYLKNE